MPVAIGLITIGTLLVASALKGVSIPALLSGVAGDILDPSGNLPDPTVETPTSGPTPLGKPTTRFKGPKAELLEYLAGEATGRFHLTIGDVCRAKNANYGAKNSLHKECRAFDASGKPADMMAYAKFAHATPGVDEVFYDPAGWKAPGFDHDDHVHTGA